MDQLELNDLLDQLEEFLIQPPAFITNEQTFKLILKLGKLVFEAHERIDELKDLANTPPSLP